MDTDGTTSLPISAVRGPLGGRLQIWRPDLSNPGVGRWHYVCTQDVWTQEDAAATCRQLGFRGGWESFEALTYQEPAAVYGPSVKLDAGGCTRTDAFLSDCAGVVSPGEGETSCPTSASTIWVGILCGAKPPPPPHPPFELDRRSRTRAPPHPPPPPFRTVYADGMEVSGRFMLTLLPLLMLFWVWFTPFIFSFVLSVFEGALFNGWLKLPSWWCHSLLPQLPGTQGCATHSRGVP